MAVLTNKSALWFGIALSALTPLVHAAEIDTNIAQMQAMDKITGKVSVINVPVNGNVNFGSFSIVVRSCKTRPPEDTPENFAFVDVVDNYNTDNPVNIFRGWMISSSPALNPVEHPIYDVWLLKCINGEVNPKALLSQEALAARDKIVKAPKLDENSKLKNNDTSEDAQSSKVEPAAGNDKLQQDNAAVESQTAEKLPEKEPQETQPELENTDLTVSNVSNPSTAEDDFDSFEPQQQEDGTPKSLLNVGNTFVPPADDEPSAPTDASTAETENGATELLNLPEAPSSTGTTDSVANTADGVNENSHPTVSPEANSEQDSVKSEAKGFLDNFLSFGSDDDEQAPVVDNIKSATEDAAEEKEDSTINFDEIDAELSVLNQEE